MLRVHRLDRIAWAVAACAIGLGGCASAPALKPPATTRTDWSYGPKVGELRDQREQAMREVWVGRARSDLVSHFGPPKMVVGVPGPRQPPVVLLTYQGLDPRSGCVDAFVVRADASQEISDYICR